MYGHYISSKKLYYTNRMTDSIKNMGQKIFQVFLTIKPIKLYSSMLMMG